MQIPFELVIVGFIVLALMIFMVIGAENTVPMYVRAHFDDTCNKYLAIIERDGGLDAEQRSALRLELENMGIVNVSIDAPMSAGWGEKVTLKVEGDYVFRSTDYRDLSKSAEAKRIVYENSTVMVGLS